MGSEDRVDVVITTFNRPEMVQRAVRSVLAQTHQNVRIIVVDDASDSDTASALRDYRDSVELVRHSRNRGASAARNTGLKRADSPFVGFLDDDDEYEPRKLERQLELLRSAPPSVIGIDSGSHLIAGGRRTTIGASMGENGRLGLLRHSVRGGMTPTLLYRRDRLEGVLFDERLPAYDEYDFLLRATSRGEVVAYDEPLIRVHQHGGPRVTSPENELRALEYLRAKHGPDIEADEIALLVWQRKLGRLNLTLGRPSEARRHFREAATSPAAPTWFRVVAAVPAFALPTVWRATVAAARVRDRISRRSVAEGWNTSQSVEREAGIE